MTHHSHDNKLSPKINNNQRFVSAEVIAYELAQVYKSKEWNIGNIRTWCAAVETRFIKDIGTMVRFEQIDLTVDNEMVYLPCNVFSILDVYESSNIILDYNQNGSFLYDFTYNGTHRHYNDGGKIYINYIGNNIDENTGEILIVKGHEEACKTYCKIQMFEEDMAFGRFDARLWALWKEEFSGQVQAAKYNIQHKSRHDIDNLNIIRGNMVPKIGSLILHHELFKQ